MVESRKQNKNTAELQMMSGKDASNRSKKRDLRHVDMVYTLPRLIRNRLKEKVVVVVMVVVVVIMMI